MDSEKPAKNKVTPNSERKPEVQTKDSNPGIPSSASPPELPPAQAHYKIARQTEEDWWDKHKRWVELCGVLLLAMYTAYTIRMYYANRDAANAAKSAANTAAEALGDSQKSFEVENRPYVIIDGTAYFLRDDKGHTTLRTANVNYKNVGKTPAQDVVAFARYTSIRFHRKTVSQQQFIAEINGAFQPIIDDDTKAKSADVYQQLDKADVAPEAPAVFISRDVVGETLSEKDLPEIESGDVTLFYFGKINYKGFERKKAFSTDFCFYFFGKDTKTWHFCPVHNTLD